MIFVAAAPVRADVYAYTDEHGVLHLSDAPRDARYHLVLTEPKPVPAPSIAPPVEPALVQAVIQPGIALSATYIAHVTVASPKTPSKSD